MLAAIQDALEVIDITCVLVWQNASLGDDELVELILSSEDLLELCQFDSDWRFFVSLIIHYNY